MPPRKKLIDNIQGITGPAITRLARRGGVKSISGDVPAVIRGILQLHMKEIIEAAVVHTENSKRKTVGVDDILLAIEDSGSKMAFSKAMKKAVTACKSKK